MMPTDRFETRLDLANDRLLTLQQQAAAALKLDTEPIFVAALGDLSTALEELHVVAEELNERNAELLAARADLEVERQHYQDLFEFAPDGYLVTSPTGMIQEANRAAANLLGVRADYLVGKPLLVFVAEADRPVICTALAKLASSQHPLSWEMDLRSRQGAACPVTIQVAASPDAQGRVRHLRWMLHDITERKQAEKAQQDSERFAYATIEALAAHLCVLDEQGCILSVNRAWREFARANGLTSPNETIGDNYLAVCEAATGDDAPTATTLASGIRAVLAGARDEFVLEYPCHSPTEQRWFSARVTRFPSSGPTRIVVAHENITARKQTEQELRQLARAVEQSPMTIVITDATGAIEYANPKFTQTTGYTVDEARGQNPRILKSGNMSATAYQQLWATILAGEEWRGELHNKKKNGDLYWEAAIIAPIWDEHGVITHFVAVKEDITARKQLEEDLRRSKSQYDQLVANLPVGVYVIRSTRTAFAFEYVSPKLTELLNVSAEAFLAEPQTAFAAIHPDDVAALIELNQARFLHPQPFEWEGRAVIGGAVKWVRIASSPQVQANGDILWSGFVADITDRRQAEEALRQSEEHYRALIEGLPGIVYSFSSTRGGLYYSPHVLSVLGYTPAQLYAQPMLWNQSIHPDDLPRIAQVISQTQAGEPFRTEYRIRDAAGNWHWFDDRSFRYRPTGTDVIIDGIAFDITDRKQAEARTQAMLHAIPDLLFRLDRHGVFLDYKADIRDMYVQANPIGLRNRDIVPPDFADLIDQQIDLTLQTRTLRTFEYQLPIPGRGVRDYEARMTPSGDDEVTAVVRDITDRKRAEEEFIASELRYRRLFETTQDGILILDADTSQVVDVNPFLMKMLGYSHADLLGKKIWELGFFTDRAANKLNFRELQQYDYIRYEDLPLETADGRQIDVEFISNTYRVNHLKVIQCNIRDITDRKRAEDALRSQHDLSLALNATTSLAPALELILHAALSFEGLDCGGIYLTDPANGAIELAVHHGLSPQFIAYAAHYSADRPQVQLMRAGQPFYGTYQDDAYQHDPIRVAEGLHSFATTPVMHQGQLLAVLNLASHTHDAIPPSTRLAIETLSQQIGATLLRLRADAALRDLNATLEQRVADRTRQLSTANQRLLELDHLKDQFISRISHELRTPLTSIKIYLEMLDRVSPEKRVHYMQVLTEQTNRLQAMIEDLLAVTEQSVNSAGLHLVPIELNHLIAAHVPALAARATQRGLTIATTLALDLPLVAADAILLSQALANLTTNALNYTPAGGAIELRTAVVSDDAHQTWSTVTVRDTGPGILPDELPHIFDRFYRGRAADDYKTPGAGVGLALSQDILAALDGRLTVQSDGVPGHGAAFTIWLKPVQPRAAEGAVN